MGHKVALAILLVAGLVGSSLAVQTGSNSSVVNNPTGMGNHQRTNTILVLETTSSALGQALTDLGQTYDYVSGPPFLSDYSQYTDVFLGMDGGLVEPTDIQPLAAWAQAGGRLHFYGGTCWQDYANGMNTYLVGNDVNNYCWTECYNYPQMTVVDPAHCLATGLPGTYNWSDMAASYYQFRATDGAIAVAANNGDGVPMLFSKVEGAGTFDYCIDSAYASYYLNQGDYNIFKQIVSNMLTACGGPTPVQETSWGAIKNMYH